MAAITIEALVSGDSQAFETLLAGLLSQDNQTRAASENAFTALKAHQDACVSHLLRSLRSSPDLQSKGLCAVLLRKVLTKDDPSLWPGLSAATKARAQRQQQLWQRQRERRSGAAQRKAAHQPPPRPAPPRPPQEHTKAELLNCLKSEQQRAITKKVGWAALCSTCCVADGLPDARPSLASSSLNSGGRRPGRWVPARAASGHPAPAPAHPARLRTSAPLPWPLPQACDCIGELAAGIIEDQGWPELLPFMFQCMQSGARAGWLCRRRLSPPALGVRPGTDAGRLIFLWAVAVLYLGCLLAIAPLSARRRPAGPGPPVPTRTRPTPPPPLHLLPQARRA